MGLAGPFEEKPKTLHQNAIYEPDKLWNMLNMKQFFLSWIGLCFFSTVLWGQTPTQYNLSFDNAGFAGNTFCVEIYLSFNQSNKLGSSNLVLDFDKSIISNPILISDNISDPPIYFVPTVTMPGDERASLNIELGIPGFGDPIGAPGDQRLIANLCFDYPVTGQLVTLTWYENASAGTVVYLDDEMTQLNPGTLQGYSGVPGSFPVEWLDFQAVLVGTNAQLDWSTASELNNSHFEIERSVDGLIFERIGEVRGSGNTPTAQRYDFLDPGITETGLPYVFYRLRQVDFDGGFSLSPVVRLTLSDLPILYLEGNPNPFTNELTIRYANSDEKLFILTVLNSLGQEVWATGKRGLNGKILINTEAWAKGVYFLSAENEVQKIIRKIIKQ